MSKTPSYWVSVSAKESFFYELRNADIMCAFCIAHVLSLWFRFAYRRRANVSQEFFPNDRSISLPGDLEAAMAMRDIWIL